MADQSFICPRCRRRSINPGDVAEGYCGSCHQFTGKFGYLVGGPGHGQTWPWPETALDAPDRLAVQAVGADPAGTACAPLYAEPLLYERAPHRHTNGLWIYTAPGVELTPLRLRMPWPLPDGADGFVAALAKWSESAALSDWSPVDGLQVKYGGNPAGSGAAAATMVDLVGLVWRYEPGARSRAIARPAGAAVR
jgi:hypothetical protein